MTSPRGLIALSVPVIVGAVLMPGAAVAAADAADDAFLTRMQTLGFTWPDGEDSTIIALGRKICTDRAAGKTPDEIAYHIHSTLGPEVVTFPDVTSMVSAAESNYCPD
ncbi:DUF732 domain-containing protein [Mycobacterium sp. HUMS_1102779]|uniref:DUF732 domain-containing protein n=1 Tax=Mycobacterium sp. HUMS_1102779 TaxID=3383487 RepID=UPI00389A39C3